MIYWVLFTIVNLIIVFIYGSDVHKCFAHVVPPSVSYKFEIIFVLQLPVFTELEMFVLIMEMILYYCLVLEELIVLTNHPLSLYFSHTFVLTFTLSAYQHVHGGWSGHLTSYRDSSLFSICIHLLSSHP